MNQVFLVLIAGSVLTAAFTGTMADVMSAAFASAKSAVNIAFGLLGAMVLFLGMIQVLRDAGAVAAVARGLAPVMRRLFPEVPADHPAMGAMVMNIAANIFGLGNSATPFGLKAMQELDRLNPYPGVATNAMVLFLAINTSGVAVFPSGVISYRESLGALDPGGIVIPSILATMTSTTVGILVATLLSRRPQFEPGKFAEAAASAPSVVSSLASGMREVDASELLEEAREPAPQHRKSIAWLIGFALLVGLVLECVRLVGGTPLSLAAAPDQTLTLGEFFTKTFSSQWLIPLFLAFIVLFGWARGVKVYESAIRGAKEGFQIFVLIVPFLVMILVAVGMFRASGALDAIQSLLAPVTSLIGFPVEALPMALLRPLSGGGASGIMNEAMQTYGPDSFVGNLVSVLNGSTETTFYVLAVYFGSVQIRAVRHAVIACLSADVAGVLAALFFTRLFLS